MCNKCKKLKEQDEYYKNSKKLNGLESHCKICVLERKKKKYAKVKFTQVKNKRLRLLKKVNVLNVGSCYLKDYFPQNGQNTGRELMKEMVEELLCQIKISP